MLTGVTQDRFKPETNIHKHVIKNKTIKKIKIVFIFVCQGTEEYFDVRKKAKCIG